MRDQKLNGEEKKFSMGTVPVPACIVLFCVKNSGTGHQTGPEPETLGEDKLL